MACGLYGKLPAKRDFIALAIPAGVLKVYEPWLQSGIAASRLHLGEGWTAAYLRAPIWRFWLGPEIAGAATLGALMPSADGVGRYFPLTLIAQGDGSPLPPPEEEPFDGWFGMAETVLLSALSQETGFDAVAADLARMSEPVASRLPPSGAGIARLRGSLGGALVGEAREGGFAEALDRLRPLGGTGVHDGTSYWWTAGGEGFPARVVACRRMPHPELFAGLLTGRFDELAA